MTPYEHSDYLALVAGISAAPDDDAPRLIAADWLEEHGEEKRAEFIRLQCAYERWEKLRDQLGLCNSVGKLANWFSHGHDLIQICPSLSCQRCLTVQEIARVAMEAAQEERVDGQIPFGFRHADIAWAMELFAPWSNSTRWGWKRGWINEIECTGANWREFRDSLLAQHPVQKVTVTSWGFPEMEYRRRLAEQWQDEWPGITFQFPIYPDPWGNLESLTATEHADQAAFEYLDSQETP